MVARTMYYTKSQLDGIGKMTKQEIKQQLIQYFGFYANGKFTFKCDLGGVLVTQNHNGGE